MTRQHARLVSRRARGLCLCATGKLETNPKTGQFYHRCPACMAKKNDWQRGRPRRAA